jgi:hypothetical protein
LAPFGVLLGHSATRFGASGEMHIPSGGGAFRWVDTSALLELLLLELDDELPLSAAAAAAAFSFLPFLPFDCAPALETAPAQHSDRARRIEIGFCMPVTFRTDR